MLSPDFITDGRTLVLIGKPGRGKTHLAVSTAYRHIQIGFEALFVTAAKIIDHLSAAAQGRMTEVLCRCPHPALLVVDELGYLSYGNDAANMLFHVVNDRYLNGRSMVFTTNKKLTDWGAVLNDHDLAAAIVDRLLERGRIIALDGPSMRSRHPALDDQIKSMVPHEPDRLSGTHTTLGLAAWLARKPFLIALSVQANPLARRNRGFSRLFALHSPDKSSNH